MKIYDRVSLLLKQQPKARELKNRKRLEWLYWTTFDGLKSSMTKEDYLRMTSVESIDRAWRKVMEKEYPDMDRTERDNRELEVRNDLQIMDADDIKAEVAKEFKRSGKSPSEIAKEAFEQSKHE